MPLPPSVVGVLGFILLFVLIFLNLPVAFAFAFVGFAGMCYLVGLGGALGDLPATLWDSMTSYTLTCLPLFVLMGMFAYKSDIGPDLYSMP